MSRAKARAYPEIPNQKRFTISEACELCDVKQHVLRYWESKYKKLQKVERRNNRRYYTTEDLLTIRMINKLKDEGLNSRAIAVALENGKGRDSLQTQVVDAKKIRSEIEGVIRLLE